MKGPILQQHWLEEFLRSRILEDQHLTTVFCKEEKQ
jgi:hypothetical protein